MAGSQTTIFDDRNPVLQYQGGWFNQGTWNASNLGPGHTGTLSSTNDPNAIVKFIFPVPAIGFSYFGMKRSKGGSYGICVDCDPNAQNFKTIDALDPTDNGGNLPVMLFSTQFPTPAVHEIILRNQLDSRFPNGNSQITVDRFEIQIADSNPPPPSPAPAPAPTPISSPPSSPASVSTSVPTSTSISASSSATSTNTSSIPIPASALASTSITTSAQTQIPTQPIQTSAQSTQTAPSQNNSKAPPVGAIVGGILGGLTVLLVILTAWFWCWRKRRDRRSNESERLGSEPSLTTPHPQPSSTRTSEVRVSTREPTVYRGEKRTGVQQRNDYQSRPSLESSSDWTSTATSYGRVIQREIDAGPVRVNGGVGVELLPPDYEQVANNSQRRTGSDPRLNPVGGSGGEVVQNTSRAGN